MTQTQWLFEYHALKAQEKHMFTTSHRILKSTLINLLGLNALRPEDESGNPKSIDKLSKAEIENHFIPLTIWTSRPDMMEKLSDQYDKDKLAEEGMNDQAYEDLVAQIDAAGGDMDPILDIPDTIPKFPNGKPIDPLYQRDLDNMVIQQDTDVGVAMIPNIEVDGDA